jgi:hypothetical protein
MLNVVTRWILSPLESVQSPMVEDWQSEATGRGCTPDQVEMVSAKAHEFYPAYDLPVARQYALQYEAPFHGDGFALVYCEMDITHLQAAQKDPRLTIFNSLDDAVHQAAVDSHAHLFEANIQNQSKSVQNVQTVQTAPSAPSLSTLRELLAELSARHVKFSASE